MNCKAGDMAIIVRVPAHWLEIKPHRKAEFESLLGKVVTCVALDGENMLGQACWRIDNPFRTSTKLVTSLEDCILMPIRGNITEDQTDELEVA